MLLCSHYYVLHLLCGDSLLSFFSDLIWNKAIESRPLKRKEQFIWPFFKMVPAGVTEENSTNRPRMWLFKLGQSSLRPFIKMAWKHLGSEAIERNSVMLVSNLLVLLLGLVRKKVIWSLKKQGNSIGLLFFFFFFTCQFSESQFLVYGAFRCCEYHSISFVWAPFILWILRVLSVLLVGTYTNQTLLPLSLWLISVPCNESMYVGTVIHCNFQEKVALTASGTDSLLS